MRAGKALLWACRGLLLAALARGLRAVDSASPATPDAPPGAALAHPVGTAFVGSMQGTVADGDLRVLRNGPSADKFSPEGYAQLVRLFDY